MSELIIRDLRASVPGKQILNGVSLTVRSGEVHVIMGPNGAGKSTLSHVMMGRPGYSDISGSVTLDGKELLSMSVLERARAGLYLAMQYPVEVPGVALEDTLREATLGRGVHVASLRATIESEADRLHFDRRFLERTLNVDMSGGERKRNETLMLSILQPSIAILDEIDSGLDVDALRDVSRRIEALTLENNLGVLAITHYNRLLHELHADAIHVLVGGQIVESGGPELAAELERSGYEKYGVHENAEFKNAPLAKHERPEIIDVWGGPSKGVS